MDERISKVLNHPATIPAAVGALSFFGGLGVGYILGKRPRKDVHELPEQLSINFDAESLSEIQDNEESVRRAERNRALKEQMAAEMDLDEEEEEDPEDYDEIMDDEVAEQLKESMQNSDLKPDEEVMVVFADSVSDWDWEVEKANRSSDSPYILHSEEFHANELGYTQITLCYYEGDNVMADDDSNPIYNFPAITGELRFGHGTTDPNVVHVRNDKHKAEYEILRHTGLYSREVMGLEIEDNVRRKDLRHSANKKFRPED